MLFSPEPRGSFSLWKCAYHMFYGIALLDCGQGWGIFADKSQIYSTFNSLRSAMPKWTKCLLYDFWVNLNFRLGLHWSSQAFLLKQDHEEPGVIFTHHCAPVPLINPSSPLSVAGLPFTSGRSQSKDIVRIYLAGE